MSQKNVEQFLGRVATDPALRRRFRVDRHGAIAAFRDEGYELSAVETSALVSLDADTVEAFAGRLDPRIQRADEARS